MSSSDDSSDEVRCPSVTKKPFQPLLTTNNQRGHELLHSKSSILWFLSNLIDLIHSDVLVDRQSSTESELDIETLDDVNPSSINKQKQQGGNDVSSRGTIRHFVKQTITHSIQLSYFRSLWSFGRGYIPIFIRFSLEKVQYANEGKCSLADGMRSVTEGKPACEKNHYTYVLWIDAWIDVSVKYRDKSLFLLTLPVLFSHRETCI